MTTNNEGSSRWFVTYETARVGRGYDTERAAWCQHDAMVCRGLNPDALAVIEVRS
jgi:hypothetical protein